MSERFTPTRVGEGFLGMEAQAVARYDSDHALDRSSRDQSGRGDDGQQRFSTSWRDGGEDVVHVDQLTCGNGLG